MQPDLDTVHDIVHAAREIADFTRGMSESSFAIGEAVKRLSESFRLGHPAVPWSEIAGMRDRLIHNYDEVDLGIVWSTIQTDVPRLLARLEPLLPPSAD